MSTLFPLADRSIPENRAAARQPQQMASEAVLDNQTRGGWLKPCDRPVGNCITPLDAEELARGVDRLFGRKR